MRLGARIRLVVPAPAGLCLSPVVAENLSAFRNFTVEHGLSQSQVETLAQDRQGYLWAGTHHGLSRFDGSSFTNFTRKDGLLENIVTASLVDRRGVIWFGHAAGGISSYDGSFSVFSGATNLGGAEVTVSIP